MHAKPMPAIPRTAMGCVISILMAGGVSAAWPGAAAATAGTNLQAQFSAAAAEFGVPAAVLLAVGYEESRWESHTKVPSVAGGFGPMHLTDTAALGRRNAPFEGDARGIAGAPVRSDPLGTVDAPQREPSATPDTPQREPSATPDTLPAAAALLGVTGES